MIEWSEVNSFLIAAQKIGVLGLMTHQTSSRGCVAADQLKPAPNGDIVRRVRVAALFHKFDADPVLLNPNNPASADHSIALSHQLKSLRNSDRIGHVCAVWREISNRTWHARTLTENAGDLVYLGPWRLSSFLGERDAHARSFAPDYIAGIGFLLTDNYQRKAVWQQTLSTNVQRCA